MKKILIYILLVLAAVIIIPIAFLGLSIAFDLGNPMRQSNEKIRADLMELTPIGMNIEDVLKVVEDNGWRIEGISEHGYETPGMPSYGERIGEKELMAILGSYKIFSVYSYTTVAVSWAFDENSELIEAFVERRTPGYYVEREP